MGKVKAESHIREWLGRYCSEPIEDNGNLDVGGNKERNRMETNYSEQISTIFMFDGYHGHTCSLGHVEEFCRLFPESGEAGDSEDYGEKSTPVKSHREKQGWPRN